MVIAILNIDVRDQSLEMTELIFLNKTSVVMPMKTHSTQTSTFEVIMAMIEEIHTIYHLALLAVIHLMIEEEVELVLVADTVVLIAQEQSHQCVVTILVSNRKKYAFGHVLMFFVCRKRILYERRCMSL